MSEIDWDKVISNLREQTNFYTEQANAFSSKSGHYDMVKEMRASANIASILASALTAGIVKLGPLRPAGSADLYGVPRAEE